MAVVKLNHLACVQWYYPKRCVEEENVTASAAQRRAKLGVGRWDSHCNDGR